MSAMKRIVVVLCSLALLPLAGCSSGTDFDCADYAQAMGRIFQREYGYRPTAAEIRSARSACESNKSNLEHWIPDLKDNGWTIPESSTGRATLVACLSFAMADQGAEQGYRCIRDLVPGARP